MLTSVIVFKNSSDYYKMCCENMLCVFYNVMRGIFITISSRRLDAPTLNKLVLSK